MRRGGCCQSGSLLLARGGEFDRLCGVSGFAAVGGLLEGHAAGAELGVRGELVLNVRNRAVLAVAAQQLYRAVAILAAELGVVVCQGIDDALPISGLKSWATSRAV